MAAVEAVQLQTDRMSEILDRAAELFAAKGVDQASMAAIANAVGIQKPSLYHFFASKEHLLAEVLRPVVEGPYEELLGIANGPGTVVERVREGMAALGRAFEQQPARMQILVRERLHLQLGDGSFRQLQDFKSAYTDTWRRLVREGIETGVFRPCDDKTTAFALIGSLNWMYAWFSPGGPRTGAQIGREFAEVFIAGLLHDDE